MGASLADLDQRDIARLRAELNEAIAAEFAYPPYFDYRAGRARVRPIGGAKRQEIAAFVQSIAFDPIAHTDVGSSEVRRFLEAHFLRFLELNGDLARGPARRRLPSMRTQAPRVAAEVQRGLVALAAGAPGQFGAPRPAETWASSAPASRPAPTWQRIERGTALLQAALLPREAEAPAPTPAPPSAMAPPANVAPSWPPPPPRPAVTSAWADAPLDGTAPLPTLRAGSDAPFAGLETGSQTALFGAQARLAMSEQPTGPQPIVGLGSSQPSAPRALPPELLQLYGDYLRDQQPEAQPTGPLHPQTDHLATLPTGSLDPLSGPLNGVSDLPHAIGWAPQQTSILPSAAHKPTDGKTDLLVFEQLRHQLDAYIRMAARSYGVRARGSDPASAIDALRRSGHVDEADLRIAEGILAIADRVAAAGSATVEDYRQAFMLYLLYHRGRIGT